MTIKLLKGQTINGQTFAKNAVVAGLAPDVEAALVQGGGAVVVATESPGTPTDWLMTRDAAQFGGTGGTTPTLYATLPLLATGAGRRQAVGGAKTVSLSAPASVSVYVRWSDASGALAVSAADTLVAIAPGAPQNLTVPTGQPFFEYMLASGGPVFSAGLMV